VAQFGGAWLGRVGGRRLCGGSESQEHGEGPAPPAGALQRGAGAGRVVGRRSLLVVAFVPDPSSLSSPGGNHPVLAVSSRITRCCGAAPSGWTPPGRAGCASTADSDEGSGTTPPVGRIPTPSGSHGHRRVRVPSGPRPHHRGGVRIPRRCRRAQPSWPGRWCQAERFCRPAGVIRLDTTGPACFREATTATRDPGRRRPQAATAAQQRDPPPPPVAERPPEAPALHHDFDFQAPSGAHAHDRRPPTRPSHAPPNCATSGSGHVRAGGV